MNNVTKLFKKLRSFKIPEFAFCLLLSNSTIFTPQGPVGVAEKYNISFPVKELGYCANFSECRTFCEETLNKDACVTFAKSKGFYLDENIEKETTLGNANKILGCNSKESCQTLCDKTSNQDTCSTFAEKYGLSGGFVSRPSSDQIIEKARSSLGCFSYNSCKAYCELETNRAQCGQFARLVGMRGGTESTGPGACTSEVTCKAYCSNPSHFEECSNFAKSQALQEFKGPGGCNSEESCKTYCSAHPQECYGYSHLPYKPSDPVAACTTIAGCYWAGNTCQCLGGGDDPLTTCQNTPGCSWTGTTCQCSSNTPNYQDPASSCRAIIGCTWTGTSCQCLSPSPTSASIPHSSPTSYPNYYSNPSPTSYYTSTPSPYPTPYPTYSQNQEYICNNTSGCHWTGTTCQCSSASGSSTPSPTSSYASPTPYPTYSSQDQETICKNTSGCSWTGTTCQCSSVHGLTTTAKQEITFPIAELGNCSDCESCNRFCAVNTNQDACVAYSKKGGFYEEEKLEEQKLFQDAKAELGCEDEVTCSTLCQKEEHYEACKIFAAKHDIIHTPVILNPLSGTVVKGIYTIEIKGERNSSLDILLQPLSSITDSLYVGRSSISFNTDKTSFLWDTANIPNGEYNLLATFSQDGKTPVTISPVKITVDNPSLSPNTKPVSVSDIVLPSQFDPNSTPESSEVHVEKVENTIAENNKVALTFQGKASPNTIVTLLIYSNPIVVTVKTDANGVWKYNLEKPLESGKHVVYALTPKSDGTKIRSEVSEFFIAPGFAASANNESLVLASATADEPLKRFLYATGAVIMAGIGGLFVLFWFKMRNYGVQKDGT